MTRTAFKQVASVTLDQLLLDTSNARIRAGADQPDCIDRLLRKPKQLLALAKDIASNGLSTAPILVEPVKGGRYIVWDGNRRVTALKLLNDPSLCHNKALQAQFAGVASKATVPIPSAVDVMASRDRQALLQEVLARHAGALEGAGQLDWDALLRTMFLLGHKAAPKDYRLSGLLLMWAEEHGIEVDDKFPITTVHRFLNQQNLERLGFRDKKDAVEPTIEKDAAVRVVERIVQDFGSGQLGVDDVFTASQQDAYIRDVLASVGLAPASKGGSAGDSGGAGRSRDGASGKSGQGTDTTSGSNGDGNGAEPGKAAGRRRSLRKPDWDRKSVVRPRFKPEIPESHWKADEVVKELRRIETQRAPLSVAALFRMFFELSTRAYMKRHKLQDKGEMHKNALLVAADMRAHGRLDEQEQAAANRRFKDKSQAEALLQYATLNDYMHSLRHMPDRQSLHVLWSEVEPYLEACWEDARRPD